MNTTHNTKQNNRSENPLATIIRDAAGRVTSIHVVPVHWDDRIHEAK